jgi:hypothetical protein
MTSTYLRYRQAVQENCTRLRFLLPADDTRAGLSVVVSVLSLSLSAMSASSLYCLC